MNDQLKRQVLEANLLLEKMGLVIFTWGNVSAIERQTGLVAIKPSGVPYADMGIEDIVVVDLEGNVREGSRNPSSDLATHLVIYQEFEQCGAVVHTHSRMATAFAQAGLDLPAYGTTHADDFYGAIPCTRPLTEEEIKGSYEYETGKVIAETFRDRNLNPMDIPSVLVHSHGPFAWAKTPIDAVNKMMVFEEVATIACHTRMINPEVASMDQNLLDKHFLRKHGDNAYYGQK